jgi:hypothetical protein
VADVTQARPGDIIAWRRPPWFPSKSTGHVAFIVETQGPNTGPVPGYLFRIADATRFPHEDDNRSNGTTGFGMGTLLLPTNGQHHATGYGWIGSRSPIDWVVPADVAIGRALW